MNTSPVAQSKLPRNNIIMKADSGASRHFVTKTDATI